MCVWWGEGLWLVVACECVCVGDLTLTVDMVKLVYISEEKSHLTKLVL